MKLEYLNLVQQAGRDNEKGAYIEVDIFDDCVEISNPGALPKPYEELQKGDISLPRNPIITKIFRIIDLVENAGYGFDKMFKGWRHHYSKEPVVSTGLDYYKIEFFFEELENVPENVPEKRLERIIEFIRKDKNISISAIADALGVAQKTIKRDIRKLKKTGFIKRIGPEKGGHGYWEITKKGGKR